MTERAAREDERDPTPPGTRRGGRAAGRMRCSSTRRAFSRCSCWRCSLGILVALAYAAVPAMQKFGLAFFVTDVWNPVTSQFGALAPIYGTLVTSAIALADRRAA